MAFPTSPANNQTALVNGIVYQWNSSLGVWKRNGSVNSIQVGQLLLSSAQQTTTNGSGTLIVSGGAGITGNVYTGGIFVTGASSNGITFVDGTKQTTAATNIDTYARTTVNTVSTLAQAAFDKANTAITTSGGSITGSLAISQNLSVTGNLSILGTTTTINTSSLSVSDSLITLGVGNYASDLLDIGISGHYNDGTNAHTGFIRDSSTKEWYVFKGYTPELTSNNHIDINHASFAKANVNVDYVKGNVVFSDGTTQTTAGSSAATSQAAFDQANAANQYANSAFAKANTVAQDLSNFTSLFVGIEATQNTRISAIETFAQGAYNQANTGTILAQAAYNSGNTSISNITILQGVNATQNTNITTTDTKAQAAFDKANSAAEAANSAGSVLTSTVDEFTGNGSNTAFTLSVEPASINYTTAVVGGVMQPRSAYSVLGTTITFTSAPVNGQIVEVTTIGTSNTTLYTVTTNVISPFLLMGA